MAKKNNAKDFFPFMPFWGWSEDERKDHWDDFKTSMDDLWNQFQEMQKAAKKAWTEQWETFFSQLMDMQQTVADSLPDEKFSVPGMPTAPVSPKEFVEKAMDFQETANAHAVKQADNMFDLQLEQQQQVKDVVTDAVQTVEDDLNDEKDEKDEKPVEVEAPAEIPAEKPVEKKTAAKKPAEKKPAAKKPAAKKPAAEKPAEAPAEVTIEVPAETPAGN